MFSFCTFVFTRLGNWDRPAIGLGAKRLGDMSKRSSHQMRLHLGLMFVFVLALSAASQADDGDLAARVEATAVTELCLMGQQKDTVPVPGNTEPEAAGAEPVRPEADKPGQSNAEVDDEAQGAKETDGKKSDAPMPVTPDQAQATPAKPDAVKASARPTRPAPPKSAPPKPPAIDGVNFINDVRVIQYADYHANALMRSGRNTLCKELNRQAMDRRAKVSLVEDRAMPDDLPGLYREAAKSIVVIMVSRKHNDHWHVDVNATGFFVSDDGVIATNRHVFPDRDDSMFVMTSDFKIHPVVEVLAANGPNDVALCRIDSQDYKGLPIRKGAAIGESVTVISHPKGRMYYMSQGVVARRHTRPKSLGKRPESVPTQDGKPVARPVRGRAIFTSWVTITADFGKGSSGAPVLDSEGRVIAIVASTENVFAKAETKQHTQMVFRECVPIEKLPVIGK